MCSRVSLWSLSAIPRYYDYHMKAITWAIVLVGALAAGALAYLLWTTPTDQWDMLPSTALGAIAAASVAGVTALAATESVSSRRRHEALEAVNEKRKAVYDAAIQHLINAHAGGSPPGEEARIRSLLSIWASETVLTALGDYNQIVNRISLENPGVPKGAPKDVPDSVRPKLLSKVGEIAVAMRADVSEHEERKSAANANSISRMIFNDYSGDEIAMDTPEHGTRRRTDQ